MPARKPHIAIGHILKLIKRTQLRNRIKDLLKCNHDEGFERKYFNVFMREVAKEAKKIEQDGRDANISLTDGSDSERE